MNQKLCKLVNYFRTYTFPQDLTLPTDSPSLLQTTLQQAITTGKSLVDLYQQKIHLSMMQNQSLSQQIEQLKLTLLQDKKQAEKLLETERQLVDELRKQLIEKDQENVALSQRIQHLEVTQADQLNFIKRQESQDVQGYQQRIREDKGKFEQMIKTLRQELDDQKEYNEQLVNKISLLAQQLETLTEQNTELKTYLHSSHETHSNFIQTTSPTKPHPYHQPHLNPTPSTPKPFTPHLQLIHPTQQDQIMNYSYEQQHQPTALKDVLNLSGTNFSCFNMTREFLRSKEKQEKQNVDLNCIRINQQSSAERRKISYLSDRSNNNRRITLDSLEHNFQQALYTQTHHNQHHIIREFSTSDNSLAIDPYFTFFTLTAQCIKINSEYFEQIAQIDIVDKQWSYVIENRIPMNLWAYHLQNALLQHVKSPRT